MLTYRADGGFMLWPVSGDCRSAHHSSLPIHQRHARLPPHCLGLRPTLMAAYKSAGGIVTDAGNYCCTYRAEGSFMLWPVSGNCRPASSEALPIL